MKPKTHKGPVPLHLFAVTLGAVFAVEGLLMFVLMSLPPLAPSTQLLLDATCLTALSAPVIYLLLFRPLSRTIDGHASALDALRQSEDKFRSLIENAASVIVVLSPDGRITEFNREAEDLYGVRRSDVLGRDYFELFLPEAIRPAVAADMEKVLAGEHTRNFENEVNTKSAGARTLSWNVGRFLGSDGRPAGVIAIGTDVTDRKKMVMELERLAQTDPLTGAYNRTKFDEIIGLELERARRFHRPLSVIMLDIDDFKKTNDTYGHEAGDEALKDIVRIIRGHMRKTNYLIRWGGEEFLIITVETDAGGAKIFAERMRKDVEDWSRGAEGRATISLGLAELRRGDTKEGMLKRADDALYEAKRQGKNRVVSAP